MVSRKPYICLVIYYLDIASSVCCITIGFICKMYDKYCQHSCDCSVCWTTWAFIIASDDAMGPYYPKKKKRLSLYIDIAARHCAIIPFVGQPVPSLWQIKLQWACSN